jgi:hypothetical protein
MSDEGWLMLARSKWVYKLGRFSPTTLPSITLQHCSIHFPVNRLFIEDIFTSLSISAPTFIAMANMSTLRAQAISELHSAAVHLTQPRPSERSCEDASTYTATVTFVSPPLNDPLHLDATIVVSPAGSAGCRSSKKHLPFGTAPMDGEKVWYCSACGDGPFGSWFAQCISCDHHKCTYCTEEDK